MNKSDVLRYVRENYDVQPEEIETAFQADAAEYEKDLSYGSYAYYVGDKMATKHGWTELAEPGWEGTPADDDDDEDDD